MPRKEKAGAFVPGQISRTFARVPLDSITEAHRRGMPNKWAVLLMLMSHMGESEDGTVWASSPVNVVCERLGLNERQVRKAVESLKRDGMLKVIESGHNGRASVYAVAVGSPPEGYPTHRRFTSRGVPYGVGSPSGGYPTQDEREVAPERFTSRRVPYSRVGSPLEGDPNRSTQKSTSRSRYSSCHEGKARAFEKPAPIALEPVAAKSGKLHDLFEGGGES